MKRKWEIVVRPERSQPRKTRGKQARVPNNVLKMVTAACSIKQTGERSQKTRKEPKCKRKLMTSHNWVWAFSSLCHNLPHLFATSPRRWTQLQGLKTETELETAADRIADPEPPNALGR